MGMAPCRYVRVAYGNYRFYFLRGLDGEEEASVWHWGRLGRGHGDLIELGGGGYFCCRLQKCSVMKVQCNVIYIFFYPPSIPFFNSHGTLPPWQFLKMCNPAPYCQPASDPWWDFLVWCGQWSMAGLNKSTLGVVIYEQRYSIVNCHCSVVQCRINPGFRGDSSIVPYGFNITLGSN